MSRKQNWKGHFDQRHNACLIFTLHSQAAQATYDIEGIIDTGFTGFIQIPSNAGVILGFFSPPLLWSNTSYANGTRQLVPLKEVLVTVQGETLSGLCHMPPTANSPVLIGMDFLRRFNRMLVVSSTRGIHLMPE